MPYSRELPASAAALNRVDPETQATLRQTVSTAYYAFFHFLIEETCGNWARPEQRRKLARRFDHKSMSIASNRRVAEHKNAAAGFIEWHPGLVASAFSQLQENRHIADYDLSKTWSGAEVALEIRVVEEALTSRDAIRNEQIAQDYPFSPLFKERSRSAAARNTNPSGHG